MSFYWKTRTLISGDYREIEKNIIEHHNRKIIQKYKGKEDIFCVIRLHSDEGGLFCLWFKALEGIRYSLQNGYIPVIDMQTKENIFTTKKQRKQENVWEKFFEQPIAGLGYSDIKRKPNKIVLENPVGPVDHYELVRNPNILNYWRKLVHKYLRYSDEAQKEIEKYSKLFSEADRVLGVLARGTDYLNPALGHLTKLHIPEIIETSEKRLKEYGCNKIFLATEDSSILQAMKDKFGERLLYVEQKRYEGQQGTKLGQLKDYLDGAIGMNLAYLAAMHYLAKCDYFWGSLTTGSMGVFLMREEGFKAFDVYQQPEDLIKYNVDDLYIDIEI